jgi:hypothetical protein
LDIAVITPSKTIEKLKHAKINVMYVACEEVQLDRQVGTLQLDTENVVVTSSPTKVNIDMPNTCYRKITNMAQLTKL